jgi:hypothetical protein
MPVEETIVSPAVQQLITIVLAIIGTGITAYKVISYIHKMKQQIDDLEKRYNENPVIRAYEKIRAQQDEELEKKLIGETADIVGMYVDKKQEKEEGKEKRNEHESNLY